MAFHFNLFMKLNFEKVFEKDELRKMYNKLSSQFSFPDIVLLSTLLLTILFSSYVFIQTKNLEKKIEEIKKIETLKAQQKKRIETYEKTYFNSGGIIDSLKAEAEIKEIKLEDIDNDGDLDILAEENSGVIKIYENIVPVKLLSKEKKLLSELIIKMKVKGHNIEPYLNDRRFKYYRDIKKLLYSNKKISNEEHQKNIKAYLRKYVDDATSFMMKNQYWLNKAWLDYGVGPWDIVSILNKETRLGKEKGNRSIFNSLISIFLTLQTHEKFVYRNLEALLELSKQENKDIFSYKGSFMGAYELPQSLLENVSKFRIDFDNNGKIDLSTIPDAIGFIANYLSKAGYKLDRYGAIYAYNHSGIYCDYIIALGNELKQEYLKRNSLFNKLTIKEHSFYKAEKDKTEVYVSFYFP